VPDLVDIAVQTNWKYPKNAVVQCQPREFMEEEKLAIQESEELADFLKNVAQRSVICMPLSLLCVTVFMSVTMTVLLSFCLSIHLSPHCKNSVFTTFTGTAGKVLVNFILIRSMTEQMWSVATMKRGPKSVLWLHLCSVVNECSDKHTSTLK